MRFEGKESEGSPAANTALRTLDVILLRDNRDHSRENRVPFDPRCSAFKETEADPLEDRLNDGTHSQEAVEELLQRVARLEQRVQELQDHRESMSNPAPSGRKRRRRFEEMQRDIECTACRKSYGSETALKYHCKLKHGGLPQ